MKKFNAAIAHLVRTVDASTIGVNKGAPLRILVTEKRWLRPLSICHFGSTGALVELKSLIGEELYRISGAGYLDEIEASWSPAGRLVELRLTLHYGID